MIEVVVAAEMRNDIEYHKLHYKEIINVLYLEDVEEAKLYNLREVEKLSNVEDNLIQLSLIFSMRVYLQMRI